MKRTTRAFALLCVLLLAFTAYADVLAVPNGITTIESEAFSGTAKATSAAMQQRSSFRFIIGKF